MAVDTALTDALAHARTDADATLAALVDALGALPDDAGAAPSPLEGWTRGHVLSHTANVGAAMARQAEAAARGEKVAPYDGGTEGRNAAIEAGAGRAVPEHVAALTATRDRLAAAWPEPGAALWGAPVVYRDGVVADALFAWWREVRIHAVDAEAGLGLETWDEPFCAHLRDFLAERLPDDGAGLDLHGDPRDVAAWLAGRTPAGAVTASRDGAPVNLPELGPWPSSAIPRA